MSNTNPTKTSFNKDNQPSKGRGKSERTKILDAMERDGQTEDGFYDLLVKRASNPEDNFTFKELLIRLSPVPKAVSPLYEFHFDITGSPHEQALQIVDAISNGKLPSDVGNIIITSISSMLKIQEVTDIDERLKKMESQIDEAN